ncbi:MAG: TonB-dependent receptor, partial [Maribacter sp.]
LQGMRQTNKNFGEEQLIPDANTNDIGVLATSHIHFKDDSGMQVGIRFDHRNINGDIDISPPQSSFFEKLDRNFNSVNAAVGYKFNISKKSIARLNLATGFRAPNLAELTSDGVHEGTNRYEIGNPNLEREQNVQADISLEYKNKHIEFFVNGFYNAIKDYIFIEPNGEVIGEDDVFVYQQESADLYGGEIGFHLHPHPLDWLHLESSFETVIGKQKNGSYLPLIPANSLVNTIRVESKNAHKWINNEYAFITLRSVFDQNNVGNFEEPTKGYNLVGLGFGGNLVIFNTPLEMRLSAQNIFDKTFISHLSRLKTDGIANIGRNISLAVSIPL